MTNRKNRNVLDAFDRARTDIASLADWLELEIQKLEDNDREVTWASVGTLEHVRENLIETLAFFSGVEQTQIKRSLEELHS